MKRRRALGTVQRDSAFCGIADEIAAAILTM